MGLIYIMENVINKKIYIGKTIGSAEERFKQHIWEAHNENKPIYNSCLSRGIRKHGDDAFRYAVLADNIDDDELGLVEEHYINMYRSDDPEIGYNMSPGGNDNTNAGVKYDLAPDDNYSDNPRVITDDITDEEVDEWISKIL